MCVKPQLPDVSYVAIEINLRVSLFNWWSFLLSCLVSISSCSDHCTVRSVFCWLASVASSLLHQIIWISCQQKLINENNFMNTTLTNNNPTYVIDFHLCLFFCQYLIPLMELLSPKLSWSMSSFSLFVFFLTTSFLIKGFVNQCPNDNDNG